MTSHTAPRLRPFLFVATVLALVVTLVLVYRYLDLRASAEQAALAQAEAQAGTAAGQIDARFAGLMQIGDRLAADLSSGALPFADLSAQLAREVEARPDLDGIAATFEPFAFSPDLRLYQHYVFRENGGFATLDGATYDYTVLPDAEAGVQTAWYHGPLAQGAMWNEPFLATGAGKILIEYGVPFYRPGAPPTRENAAGVITIDYSVADIRALIAELELGATGYGFVVTPTGTFLAHPVAEFIVNRSVFDLADATASPSLREAATRALAGEAARIDWDDPVTGSSSIAFLQPLPSTGWVLGVVLKRSELMLPAEVEADHQLGIAIAGALTVFAFALVIAYPRGYSNRELWTISAIFSGLCLLLIVFVWVLSSAGHSAGGVVITDRAALDRYIENWARSSGAAEPPPIVPTGLLIQAMEFPDPTTVRVNGLLWQMYPADADEAVTRGFLLPGRIGEEALIEEVQRISTAEGELIVWQIGVSISQQFDPALFPFDERSAQIRIASADLDTPLIFTPDLASYDLINPRQLPGLDAGVSVLNWSLDASYFSYHTPDARTTLGVPARSAAVPPPELSFTISTQRGFVGPFIAYLLPAVIGLLMLFAYLLNERAAGDKEEITSALNFGTAIFFVMAVLHTALRDNIGATGITYLEYLYILLYVAILGIAANIFTVVRRPGWAAVRFRGNLAVKLLYLPVFSFLFLIITLAVFAR